MSRKNTDMNMAKIACFLSLLMELRSHNTCNLGNKYMEIYRTILCIRVGVKYSTCTWYLYLSTYLSVLDVLEYLVNGNVKVLVLVLDQKVLGTYK